ncbi:flagellar export chaperone FliS [Trinickia mobilis]|uniref:flagellar export chaperone FliS n=1 Tax=Trinickia mobilis TaxID=2816356 RepID=UPI001A8CC720|nr:flagellar export chaperone FliS [Trinickia mobilis]
MYSTGKFGASSYERIGIESSVLGASPHELIALLFAGARRAVRMSRMHMQSGNVAEKGKLISHAIMLIGGGLQQGLNLEKGGELARRLDGLYEYMKRRLLEANLRNDPALLDEVDNLLGTIEEGWIGIQNQVTGAASPARVSTAG